ncbi:hypothetical protein [Oscillibacter sp. GMB15532]|uniref:hypothetical protein n=1 Tax=Oscillibacter sp. GMB15532 TaxID=3230022 RepID=UPI0034DF509E
MKLNLVQTTELWINEITFSGENLADMASAVADTLQLEKGNVQVVDVGPAHIIFEVLAAGVPQENIIGKETAILEALTALSGVSVTEGTCIHSNRVLGFICAGTESAHPC